jgi:hypothetical protein
MAANRAPKVMRPASAQEGAAPQGFTDSERYREEFYCPDELVLEEFRPPETEDDEP